MVMITPWISRIRRIARSSSPSSSSAMAFSRPHREAHVPETRASPVRGFSWNGTPRAKLPWNLPV